MKVDSEKDVLENTRNNQNDVEHGLEAVEVLLNMSENHIGRALHGCMRANLLQSRLLLGWSKGVRAITAKTGFCLDDGKTARLGGINKVKRRFEQFFYFVNGTRVLGDIDVAKFSAFLARFDLGEVFVTGGAEADLLLSQLSLHLHTSGALLLVAVGVVISRKGNGADRDGFDVLVRDWGLFWI